MRNKLFLAVIQLLLVAGCGGAAQDDAGDLAQVQDALRPGDVIPDRYIVVLRDEVPGLGPTNARGVAEEHALRYGGRLAHVYEHALKGYAIELDESRARALSLDPRVKYIEPDGIARAVGTQFGATWGLDRIDQRNLPLNQSYVYNKTGSGVHAYIIDTGIRVSHSDFGGRAYGGYTAINDGYGTNDCNGHGTHVAGTVGGATWGVAKQAMLHPVRVLGCNGQGPWSGVIAGIDWVTANRVLPAVANMSLGGGTNQAVDDAVARSIASGVTYVVAAGNNNGDACYISPARTPAAITVGATDGADARAWFSNWGCCLDIFAPGVNITSASHTSNTGSTIKDGTSMASPHVAGAAALYLSTFPSASPAQVSAALVNNSTLNKVTNPGVCSPNRLLYTGFIGADTTPPTTSITAPAAGSTVQGTVTVSAAASDNVGVTRVEFFAGGALIGSDTTSPYSINWNTKTRPNGSVTLTSRAYDAAGNNRTSAGVTVTVANPTCVFSVSKSYVPSGDSVVFSLTSGGPIPSGSLAYLHGTKNGIIDENGSFATPTSFSSTVPNTFDVAGSYTRYMIIRSPSGVEVCRTSTVSVYFAPPSCVLSFSKSVVPSGGSVQFTLTSQGDIPTGSMAYLYGTKNGVTDENGSLSTPTSFSATITNSPGLAGSYVRWMILRTTDGRTICQTNSTSTVFQ